MGTISYTISSNYDRGGEATRINNSIESDTTVEDFSNVCKNNPGYSFDKGQLKTGITPLARAAYKGNVALIEHIAKNGNDSLFSIADNVDGQTPLHWAIRCEDEEKGYLAAKKLIQMKAPIKIVTRYHMGTWGVMPKTPSPKGASLTETPLELALQLEKTRIAALLLLMGDANAKVNDPISLCTLEKAEAIVRAKCEKLFNTKHALHEFIVNKQIDCDVASTIHNIFMNELISLR